MARADWIIPRADAACGRAFHPDRRSAEGYRIALEFWAQATGRRREGSRLVAYRCKRCGGYHLARKRVEDAETPAAPHRGTMGLVAVQDDPGFEDDVVEAGLSGDRYRSPWA